MHTTPAQRMAHLFHTLKRTKQWHHTHIKHTHRSSQTLSTHIPSCTTGAHRSPSHLRAFLLFYTDAASLQLHACHTRPAGRTSCSANPICRHCFMSFTTCPPEQKQTLRTRAKYWIPPGLLPHKPHSCHTHTLLCRLSPKAWLGTSTCIILQTPQPSSKGTKRCDS